ncbi:MAG: serine/threonine protein kinase [Lentisphaeraceae bacterium]|nr:serine/threonine protein kinase [Lentisphaeraceae bacterium]
MSEESLHSENLSSSQSNVNKIHCFQCGQTLNILQSNAGDKLKCSNCQTEMIIPEDKILEKLSCFESFTEEKTPKKAIAQHSHALLVTCNSCQEMVDVTCIDGGDTIACTLCKADLRVPRNGELAKAKKLEDAALGENYQARKDISGKIKIFCYSCKSKLDVTEQKVGAQFSCPACQTYISVPQAAEYVASPEAQISTTLSDSEDSMAVKLPKTEVRKLKINCHTCAAKLDVSDEKPFSNVNCPVCNAIFQVPKRFTHFLLEERLSENSSFAVYRALDLTLSREVCLKVLNKKLSAQKEAVEQFLGAAGRVALLSDVNIVPIYSSGEHEGCSYVVMQYMGGASLAPYLEKAHGKLPLNSVYRCVSEASKGLHSAHLQGVKHYNLALTNILVDDEGHIKVSDFSCTYSLFKSVGTAGDLLEFYKPQYVSPEMVKNSEGSLLGEIFSMGALFYHLLTGVEPFPGDRPQEILTQRLERSPVGPIHLRGDIPQDVSDYVLQMMSLDMNDRPQDFLSVAQKVSSFIVHDSEVLDEAAAVPLTVPAIAKDRTKTWLIFTIIAIVILLAILLLNP